MKVKEFADRIGLPFSKVRYYDRAGMICGDRIKENNYRDFTALDALHIYHAQMLRSFDMSVQEVITAQTKELTQIDNWVDCHAQELDEIIRLETAKLHRLKEMQVYFSLMREANSKFVEYDLDDSYNIFNFGQNANPSKDELDAIALLAENMPFSYVAIKVAKESVEREESPLAVSIGLGILRRNQEKLKLAIPKSIPIQTGGKVLHILLEKDDPFQLQHSDLQPLLDEIYRRQGSLKGDLIGRLYISYMKDGTFVHGIGLSAVLENEEKLIKS